MFIFFIFEPGSGIVPKSLYNLKPVPLKKSQGNY